MTLDELKRGHATNPHRMTLFCEFERYLTTLRSLLSEATVVMFGSFLSEKPCPEDIDLIVHGSVKPAEVAAFNINSVRSKGGIHVKSEISMLKADFRLMSESELVSWFDNSESNKSKGISVGTYSKIEF